LSFWERLLLVVLCDQRLMLAAPSPSAPGTSAGGGVGRCASGSALRDSEAARLTVTTDDEEREVLHDDWRRGEVGATSAGFGDAAGGRVVIFMLESSLVSGRSQV
jgi:hypothetical protein